MGNKKSVTTKLSVSIVTYNSENEIETLLESLKNCSSLNEMVVYVVDNASQDNTVSLVKEKFPWVFVIENTKNVGFGKAHNEVIKIIHSKYHIIVNPDIALPTDVINMAVEFMDNNPDVAILTPFVMNVDGSPQYLPKRNPTIKYLIAGILENKTRWGKIKREEYTRKNEVINTPIDVEFCTGAFMFIRTECLLKIGGFDERYFLHFEDADLTRELRKIGRAVYNPDIKVFHKWHRDNKKISKSFFIAVKSMFLYLKKWRGN